MNRDYARVEAAIRFLRKNLAEQPGLDEAAAHVGLSPHHFQRLFRRWAGLSPKRYLEFLTVEQAKPPLRESRSVLDTAYAVGLTSPSRLHEQFVSLEATTPGEYEEEWRDVGICYGLTRGPFGEMLIAQTARGICLLSFVNEPTRGREIERLRRLYRLGKLQRDDAAITVTAAAVFTRKDYGAPTVQLAVRGTNFQVNVWRALLKIPFGMAWSYSQLATAAGRPEAVRAVASAVAANPVNFLIPCHRVLRADGGLGGYRGGPGTTGRILEWEAATEADHHEPQPSGSDSRTAPR